MDYFFQSPFLSTSCEIWEYVKNLCVIPSEEICKPKNGIFRSVVIDIDVCDFDRAFNLPLTFHADVLLFSPANRHEFLMLTILFVSKLLEKREVHRSEEHTSELQSLAYLVCRLLLEKKK